LAIRAEHTRVACAQLAPVLGDADGNRLRAAQAIQDAAGLGAELVVLPELCTSGYAFADAAEARDCAEPIDGPTVRAWTELARRRAIVIVGGICELDADGALRNTAVVVDRRGLRAGYRKTHLWGREPLIFAAGEVPPPVIGTDLGQVGVAVCYDAFFPEVLRGLAVRGAELIAVPMNSPVEGPPLQPLAAELVLAIAAAHVNRVFIAQADRAGEERGIEWAQASAIVAPDGSLLAGPLTGTQLLMADCELGLARSKSIGEHNDVLADRRPELYGEAAQPTPTTKETVL
jgi:5-aminopentanamidase